MAVLKMATRGSPLALAQAGQAARALEKLHPGLAVETVVIKTSGDLFGAPPPEQAKLLPQGAKGLWVKELEQALLGGTVDFAAHSAKDLPAVLAPGCAVAAYPERADPRDTLIGGSFASLPRGARLATSSLRRRLMLAAARPDLAFVSVRGNVDTRLKKLAAGEFDALVLAVAGLARLGRTEAHEPLDPATLIPSPGQGALALEIRADRRDVAALVGALDHAPTRAAVELERLFLAAVGGGCGSPVAAHARPAAGGLVLDAFYADEGASAGRRVTGLCPDPARAEALVHDLARQATGRA